MSVTVAAIKAVSFKSPYIGSTFQQLSEDIFGQDGYISGGATTDNGVDVSVFPFKAVQRGIVMNTLVPATIAVPTAAEPWFVVAAVIDDDPDTDVLVSVTTSIPVPGVDLVIAFKVNGVWENALPVDVRAAATRSDSAELGVEEGFHSYVTDDGAGNVDKLVVDVGQLVDTNGTRRKLLPTGGTSNRLLELDPIRPHASRDRVDYAVLRKKGIISEFELITGGIHNMTTASTVAKAASTTRVGYCSLRGGTDDDQWYAWGEAGNLEVQGGPAGGTFAAATLVAGTSINHVLLPGIRASDDAIITVYVEDGVNLQILAFDSATGAEANAPVIIDHAGGGAITHIRAELDGESLHVVYEHTESPQQIYYTRVSVVDSAAFGAAEVNADYVQGSVTATNDTWPDVAVDSQGKAHIVYTEGSGSNEYGDFVYVIIDENGTLESSTSYPVATSVGSEVGGYDDGYTAESFDEFHRARIAVTPHDEVFGYLFGMTTASGLKVNSALLFSPEFEARLGFPIVMVAQRSTGNYVGGDILVNEPGDLRLLYIFLTDTNGWNEGALAIDNNFASNGHAGDSIMFGGDWHIDAGPVTNFDVHSKDPTLKPGPSGDMVSSTDINSGSSLRSVGRWLSASPYSQFQASKHPDDIYLAGYHIPASAVATKTSDERLHTFNTRPKKLNYAFLVGDDRGEFTGLDGIHDALRTAAKTGGTLIIRPGHYDLGSGKWGSNSLRMASGVSVVGDGPVVLEGGFFFTEAHTYTSSVNNVTGNLVESNTTIWAGNLLPGDYIKFNTGKIHQVKAHIAPIPGGYQGRILVDPDRDGNLPTGAETSYSILSAGIRIENLTVVDGTINLSSTWGAVARNLRFRCAVPSVNKLIFLENVRHATIENVDFSECNVAGAGQYIDLGDGEGCTIRNVQVRDTDAYIHVQNDAEHVTLESIVGDSTDPSKPHVNIESTRTTPVTLVNVPGEITGGAAAGDIVTAVAPRIVVGDTVGGMEFEDENTRAGPAAGIPLSSTATNGDKIPDGTTSILEAIHDGSLNQDAQFGAGLVSGGDPSLGTFFPDMDVAAAVYLAAGHKFTTGALSETSGGTSGSTVYYWHLDNSGAVVRGLTADLDSGTKVIVAKAKTNVGNTAYEEFVDMRRFVGKPDRKGPIIVGPGTTNGQNENHFFSLQGALHWLELNAREDTAEIIITGQLDMTGGETSIEIDFQTAGLRSLTIRGLGEDAGIKWGQDETLFNITGLAAKNAYTAAGQKATLRFHNLLLDNTNAAGPTVAKALFKFNSSYLTDVVIDRCRTMWSVNSWDRFVDCLADVDNFTIADNEIEDARGLLTSTNAAVDFNGGNDVRNLHIFRNVFRNSTAVVADTYGIYVGASIQNVWIVENSFEPGRDAGGKVYSNPIVCWNADSSNAPDVGCRYIVNNSIVHTEFTDANTEWAIKIVGTGDMPVFILNNQIIGNYNGGISVAPSAAHGSVIDGNLVQTGTTTGSKGITCDADYSSVINNTVESQSDDFGIEMDCEKAVCTGNSVSGGGTSAIVTGSGGGSEGVISNNQISGAWTVAGINLQDSEWIASCNWIELSSGDGIRASGGDYRQSIVGNRIQLTGGSGDGLLVDSDESNVSNNTVLTSGSSGAAGRFSGTRLAVTANNFVSDNTTDSTDGVVDWSSLLGTFVGNNVRGRSTGNYGSGGGGRTALLLTANGNRSTVIGNVVYNRGTHATKATVRRTGSPSSGSVFMGNVISNGEGSAVYTDGMGTASGWEFGTTNPTYSSGTNLETA